MSLLQSIRLDDHAAVVTGAGTGIGRDTALELGELGAQLVLVGRRTSPLEETRDMLPGTAEHLVVSCDVTEPDDIASLVATLRASEVPVTALINNAGTNLVADIRELSVADWNRLVDLDLTSLFAMTKGLLPLLEGREGATVVNVSSAFGMAGFPRVPVYSAARAGVIGLTRQLAADLGPEGIRVNVVCPGPTLSERVRGYFESGQIESSDLMASVPLGRFAECDEIARVIAFLATPAASFVHGATIAVDGGQTATG